MDKTLSSQPILSIDLKKNRIRDYLAHRVDMELLTDGNCYELYSQKFINRLCKVNSDWKRNTSYRIYGHLVGQNNVACFRMQAVTPINSD